MNHADQPDRSIPPTDHELLEPGSAFERLVGPRPEESPSAVESNHGRRIAGAELEPETVPPKQASEYQGPDRLGPGRQVLMAGAVLSAMISLAACGADDWVELENRQAAVEVAGGPAPRTGSLLWEDRYDASPFEQAFAAATAKDRVFASGFVWNPSGRDFVIRGYDTNTGELVWQDQLDRGADDFASGVVVDGKRVFASGTSMTEGRAHDWILRSYDAESGEVLWTELFDFAGQAEFSRGTTLAAADGVVVLGGYGTRSDGRYAWVLRAHDAATGALLWDDIRSVAGQDSAAYSVVINNGRVTVGGWSRNTVDARAIVRAFDLQSGTMLWEHATPGVAGDGLTYTRSLAVEGGRVFAGQNVSADGAWHVVPQVTAFDAETGSVLWSDQIVSGGDWDILHQISASGGHVVAVGLGGPDCLPGGANCDALTRNYSSRTGVQRWQHVLDLSGRDDRANLVTIANGTAFVSSSKDGEWIVQAFDLIRGELLWQSAGGEGESGIYNMVASQERLFIPGRAVDPETGDWDFLLRAYDTRGRRGDVDSGGVVAPAEVALSASSGEASYDTSSADPQSIELVVRGLIPAAEYAGTVVDDPANDIGTALQTGVGIAKHFISVPAGTQHLRVSLFDDAVDGAHDLDLYVFDSTGAFVDGSGSLSSDEHVDISAPSGDYIVVVHGYETEGPQANYVLSSWALGETDEGNLAATGPTSTGTVTITWSGLIAELRYLGVVGYVEEGKEVARTIVEITP